MTQKGTYKIAVLNDGVFASWKVGGETKRWRGDASTFAKEVPADAEDLRATLSQSRVEIFVTSGKPTRDTLKTTGTGPRARSRHASERSRRRQRRRRSGCCSMASRRRT